MQVGSPTLTPQTPALTRSWESNQAEAAPAGAAAPASQTDSAQISPEASRPSAPTSSGPSFNIDIGGIHPGGGGGQVRPTQSAPAQRRPRSTSTRRS